MMINILPEQEAECGTHLRVRDVDVSTFGQKIHSSLGCDLVLVVPFREHHRILDTRTRKHSGTYYLDGVTLKNDSETESVVLCGEL